MQKRDREREVTIFLGDTHCLTRTRPRVSLGVVSFSFPLSLFLCGKYSGASCVNKSTCRGVRSVVNAEGELSAAPRLLSAANAYACVTVQHARYPLSKPTGIILPTVILQCIYNPAAYIYSTAIDPKGRMRFSSVWTRRELSEYKLFFHENTLYETTVPGSIYP